MYYLSKLYKVGKNGIIGIGGLAGIGSVVYGIFLGQISGLILIIGGSVWIIQTGIILYDNSKLISTIRKQLVGLELERQASSKENLRMKEIIENENKNKEKRVSEIDILRAKLLGLNDKIVTLERLKEEYKRSADNLAVTNLDLKSEVDNLLFLRDSFNTEQSNLQFLLSESRNQLEEVRKMKELYEIEIVNLQKTVGDQAEKIEDYNEQIVNLTKIYEDSREIILNMAQTNMVFESISKSLNEGLVKIEEKDQNDRVGYLSRFLSKISSLVSGIVLAKNVPKVSEVNLSQTDNKYIPKVNLSQVDIQSNLIDADIGAPDFFRDSSETDIDVPFSFNGTGERNGKNSLISRDDLETLLNMKDPLAKNEGTESKAYSKDY